MHPSSPSALFSPRAFSAPLWLTNHHAQTLYGALWAPAERPSWQRQRWTTPDDDFIDVDILEGASTAPTLVIFHGLEGSTNSRYVRTLAHSAHQAGWRVVAPNFRGCSGIINRLPRTYHAGDSAEIHWILSHTRSIYAGAPLHAIGVSLGGNMLLKWLGEQRDQACTLLTKAAAVAAPLDLQAVGDHLAQGFNRLYTRHFLATLKQKARDKFNQYPGLFNLAATLKARTLREFDNHFIAPLHGFANVDDYWKRCSSKPWLNQIRVPTLLLSAWDDPFLPDGVLPEQQQCSPDVTRDFQARGGHVGFVSGRFPGQIHWMPQRVMQFFLKRSAG
ncbi:MAG: hydrolase [Betaproteobacteria bacterium]|nr:hydrolase [Betaproteobacteria bacterium]